MSFGTQTTEVLLRWKYVRQAVQRALYTLEQFTVSETEIFRNIINTCRGTKTKRRTLRKTLYCDGRTDRHTTITNTALA